jgi:hypothetical protein
VTNWRVKMLPKETSASCTSSSGCSTWEYRPSGPGLPIFFKQNYKCKNFLKISQILSIRKLKQGKKTKTKTTTKKTDNSVGAKPSMCAGQRFGQPLWPLI